MFKRKPLSLTAFSLAIAVVFSLHLALLGIASLFGFGVGIVEILGTLLIGYDSTFAGIFVGVVWGFAIGGVYGFIASWLYNKML